MSSGPAGGGRGGASVPEAAAAVDGEVSGGVPPVTSRSVVEMWKMDATPARARLLLRGIAWLFSLLALVVMASNNHGHGGAQDFHNYPEYNYCLGISIVAFLYATAQVLRGVHRLSSGRDVIAARKAAAVVDFAGDQARGIFHFNFENNTPMIRSNHQLTLSAAAPVTDYMRQAADNLFTDSAAAAISMAFFAFLAIGLSALISGYNLAMEVLV
uniref:CASP-like protein n=1 Tax=Leersia perrieri TaxID=77586 RepID=A0A0D9W0Q0_9ORYZ